MIEMLEGNAFHLATDGTSYVICITDTGHAEHIYYGKKLRDARASLTAIREKRYMVQRSAVPVNEDTSMTRSWSSHRRARVITVSRL